MRGGMDAARVREERCTGRKRKRREGVKARGGEVEVETEKMGRCIWRRNRRRNIGQGCMDARKKDGRRRYGYAEKYKGKESDKAKEEGRNGRQYGRLGRGGRRGEGGMREGRVDVGMSRGMCVGATDERRNKEKGKISIAERERRKQTSGLNGSIKSE
jgi:hypothetical protein